MNKELNAIYISERLSQELCLIEHYPATIIVAHMGYGTLPYEVMPIALQKVANILPLTQGIKLLKSASLGLQNDNMLVPLLIMVAIAIICIGVSLKFFRWE